MFLLRLLEVAKNFHGIFEEIELWRDSEAVGEEEGFEGGDGVVVDDAAVVSDGLHNVEGRAVVKAGGGLVEEEDGGIFVQDAEADGEKTRESDYFFYFILI